MFSNVVAQQRCRNTLDEQGWWLWGQVTIGPTDRTGGAPVSPPTNLLLLLALAEGAYRGLSSPGGLPRRTFNAVNTHFNSQAVTSYKSTIGSNYSVNLEIRKTRNIHQNGRSDFLSLLQEQHSQEHQGKSAQVPLIRSNYITAWRCCRIIPSLIPPPPALLPPLDV